MSIINSVGETLYNSKIPFMYKTMNNHYCEQFIRHIIHEHKREICYFLYNTHVERNFTPELYARLVRIAFTEYPDLDDEVKYLSPKPNYLVQEHIQRIYKDLRKEVFKND